MIFTLHITIPQDGRKSMCLPCLQHPLYDRELSIPLPHFSYISFRCIYSFVSTPSFLANHPWHDVPIFKMKYEESLKWQRPRRAQPFGSEKQQDVATLSLVSSRVLAVATSGILLQNRNPRGRNQPEFTGAWRKHLFLMSFLQFHNNGKVGSVARNGKLLLTASSFFFYSFFLLMVCQIPVPVLVPGAVSSTMTTKLAWFLHWTSRYHGATARFK